MHHLRTTFRAGIIAATFVGLAATPAMAHVSNDNTEVAAGSFTSITLTVPHGCDDAPTRAIAVQIPDGVLGVTPQVHPGWTVSTETEQLDAPVDLGDGESVTERTSVVTFTAQAGNELPDGFREQFTLGYRAPDSPGEYLFFKTIQTCAGGVETAWIEEYTGEGEEPEHPSPAVFLTDSSGDAHGAGDADGATDAEGDDRADGTGTTEVAAEAAADAGDDDDAAGALPIVALVVGAVGVALGGVALARTRPA